MARFRWLGAGLAGGAAGTAALNATTYLDMAIRGRASSSTPEQMVEKLADKAGLDIPGEGTARQNRLSGLGPLSGLAVGLGVGIVIAAVETLTGSRSLVATGAAAGALAMAGTDASMAALGVSRPGSWSAVDWLSDAVPHVAYGMATAAVIRAIERQ
jgi:hypothetical protein